MTTENRPIPQFQASTGQNILTEEVEYAIHLMKNGKATGPDDLPIEALKTLDEQNIVVWTDFFRRQLKATAGTALGHARLCKPPRHVKASLHSWRLFCGCFIILWFVKWD